MLGIYCRISREKEEGKDRSINDQRELGIEKGKELGLDYNIYIDEGYSGTLTKIEQRPSLSNLVDDIIEGKITSVYAYDQSRLERNPQVRFLLNNIFKENEIQLFTSTGKIDLNDEESEMLGDMVSIMNQYYVKQTKRKIKSVLHRNAKEGKAHSSIYPYGYTKDKNGYLIIDEEEAIIVKRIYDDSLQGIGTNKIAENLAKDNVPTRYNKIGEGVIKNKNKYTGKIITTKKSDITWSGNSVRGILINTIYKGVRNFGGKTYESPILIESSYWKKVNDNLKNNRNNSGKKVDHKYLLKGVLECGVCGKNLYGRTRVNKKDHYYMCSSKRIKADNCGNRSINIDLVDTFVWNMVLGDFDVKKAIKNESTLGLENKIISLKCEREALIKEINSNQDELKNSTRLIIKGIIEEVDAKPIINGIKDKIKDLGLKLKNVSDEIEFEEKSNKLKDSFVVDLVEIKNDTPYNKKRELIHKYISRIKVFYNSEVKFYYLIVKFGISDKEEIYPIQGNLGSVRAFLETGRISVNASLSRLKRMTEIGDLLMNQNSK